MRALAWDNGDSNTLIHRTTMYSFLFQNKSLLPAQETIVKANPYHDGLGRFSTGDKAGFVSMFGAPKKGATKNEPPINKDLLAERANMMHKLAEVDVEGLHKAQESLSALMKDAKVVIHTGKDDLNTILTSGGFKTSQELQSKNPSILEAMANAEKLMFGDAKKPHSIIYGVLHSAGAKPMEMANSGAVVYGRSRVTLKPEVRDRTTFTGGDSVNGMTSNNDTKVAYPPSKVTDPKLASVIGLDVYRGAFNVDSVASRVSEAKTVNEARAAAYMEAQVHGGVSVKDIQSIVVPDKNSLSKEAWDVVKAHGITVTTEEEEIMSMFKSYPSSPSSVLKANPYRDAKKRYCSKEKAVTTTSFDDDMRDQTKWLGERAKELGHPDVDTLASTDMTAFFGLAKRWRRHHAFKLEDLLGLRLG